MKDTDILFSIALMILGIVLMYKSTLDLHPRITDKIERINL